MEFGEDGVSTWMRLSDGSGFVSALNLSSVAPPVLATVYDDLSWTPPLAVPLFDRPDEASTLVSTSPAGNALTVAGLTANGFAEIKLESGRRVYAVASAADLTQEAAGGLDLRMHDSGFTAFYEGSDGDQVIYLSFTGPNTVAENGEVGWAMYQESASGPSCSSMLYYKQNNNGEHILRQSPNPEGQPCSLNNIIIKPVGALDPQQGYSMFDALWVNRFTGEPSASGQFFAVHDE